MNFLSSSIIFLIFEYYSSLYFQLLIAIIIKITKLFFNIYDLFLIITILQMLF